MKRQVQHDQKLEGLGVLAAGVAVDINALLTVIPGHGDLTTPELQSIPSAIDWRGEGTVLMVDDEELVRGTANPMLERRGYTA